MTSHQSGTKTLRRAAAPAALILAVGLALGACGGSDTKTADTGRSTSSGVTTTSVATTTPAVSPDGKVTIEGFTFKPKTITVAAGTTVTWTNLDSDAHAIKPDNGLFPNSPDITKGGMPFTHTYAAPGTYPYICAIHNSMSGTVVVV